MKIKKIGDKKMMKKSKYILLGILSLVFLSTLFFSFVNAVTPTGGSVTPGSPQTAPADTAGNNSAFAGNTTFLGVTAYSTTQTWQGYFGNVSGTIQLADASDNVIYNWTLAEPEGEVYASTNSSITWGNIQCFNFTANGTGGLGTAGSTNLGGTNLTVLESRFNIASDDVDGVNETFNYTVGSDTHDQFFTANLQFSAGECLHTRTYNSAGTAASNQFEEVLLYEPVTSSVLFASLLEEGTLNGFNSQDNDFQMIVPEDGHATDTSATSYYFFVELE